MWHDWRYLHPLWHHANKWRPQPSLLLNHCVAPLLRQVGWMGIVAEQDGCGRRALFTVCTRMPPTWCMLKPLSSPLRPYAPFACGCGITKARLEVSGARVDGKHVEGVALFVVCVDATVCKMGVCAMRWNVFCVVGCYGHVLVVCGDGRGHHAHGLCNASHRCVPLIPCMIFSGCCHGCLATCRCRSHGDVAEMKAASIALD